MSVLAANSVPIGSPRAERPQTPTRQPVVAPARSPSAATIGAVPVPATAVTPERPALRELIFSPSTPDEKIATPERNAPVAKPMNYHSANYFDKQVLGKRITRDLENKPLNTIVFGSPEGDPEKIMAKKLCPTANGLIAVPTSDGRLREWLIHREAGPKGNRLIPFRGPGVYPLSGPQILKLHARYAAEATAGSSFGDYVRQNTTRRQRKLLADLADAAPENVNGSST